MRKGGRASVQRGEPLLSFDLLPPFFPSITCHLLFRISAAVETSTTRSGALAAKRVFLFLHRDHHSRTDYHPMVTSTYRRGRNATVPIVQRCCVITTHVIRSLTIGSRARRYSTASRTRAVSDRILHAVLYLCEREPMINERMACVVRWVRYRHAYVYI